jgi:hypothetical protein
MANLQLYNQNFPANGKMIFDQGNFFFLLSAAAATNLILINSGNTELLNGISAGTQIKRTRAWQQAILSGSAGTNFTAYHGDEFSREDQTNFQSVIATVTGSVTTTPGPGSAGGGTNHADVNVATTTLDTTITANASRKSLIVGSLSSNAPSTPINLRLQFGAGVAAVEGIELQGGTFVVLPTQSAMAVYNGDATAQKYWWIEML